MNGLVAKLKRWSWRIINSQIDEEIRQEVGQQFLLIQLVGPPDAIRSAQCIRLGRIVTMYSGSLKRDQMLVHYVRAKQGFSFNRHGNPLANLRRTATQGLPIPGVVPV